MSAKEEVVATTDIVPVLRLRLPRPRPSAGVSRDIPYVLRGRDEEFSCMVATLTNSAATSYVIEGPPGTGKTALATAVGAYAAKCGYTVLDLDASEISSPFDVAQSLWALFNPQGIPNHVHRSFGGHVGLPEIGSIGANYAKEKPIQTVLRLKHYLSECFKEHATKKNQTKGFLIIFDNVASWRDATEKGHPDRKPIKAICNTLNDGVRNVSFPITTIFAGTPGTVATIRKLTSNRLDPETHLHLQGVSDLACQQIINDHLRVLDAKSDALIPPDVIPVKTMQHIVQLCDGNVWHATTIGQKLQEAILTRASEPMLPEEYCAYANQARNLVYMEMEERLVNIDVSNKKKSKMRTAENAEEKNGATFAYLAAAAKAQENRLERNRTEKILRHANRNLENNLTMTKLIQEGLIERRVKNNGYSHLEPTSPQRKHYCVPLPSFCDYILEEYPDIDRKRAAAVQKHLAKMQPIPEWGWRTEDKIRKFVTVPGKLPRKHVPGNLPRLLDAVPGD